MPWWAVLVVAAAASATPAWAALRPCAGLVVIDPIADPGTATPAGAVLDVDLTLPIDSNAQVAGGVGPTVFMTDGAVAPGGFVHVTDMEADPSGLGPDPEGEPGHGAVFVMDPATGVLTTLSDGATCGATIVNCGTTVFVNPIGAAWSHGAALLVVADIDADPSNLGPDTHSFPGHGAVLRVNPATGVVDLVADGSNYPAGIPNGAPSIFEDPLAAAFARDGRLYVADQLARPLGGNPGAVFRVDVATGQVMLVAAGQSFAAVRDVAVEPSGTVLVLDRLAGGRGMLFRVDPAAAPPGNVVAQLASRSFVEPMSVVAAGNGRIYVLDASADPLARGIGGAVFEIDAALTTATPVSASQLFASPWGLALTEPESVDAAAPAFGNAGTSLTVSLFGGAFEVGATVDFGPLVQVDAVNRISAQQLDVDITIPAGTGPQLVDVSVLNPGWQTQAFHCELFEVRSTVVSCVPTIPVGETLRVTKPEEGHVRLTWMGTADPCAAGYRVRRAFTARPAGTVGSWPTDPYFDDVTGDDADLTSADQDYTHEATSGAAEYYLVTEVGTNGMEGPSDHYGG